MNYSFLPEAESEYLAAICFYEEQQAGLGDALITEFERIIILAVEKPEAWRLVHQSGIRNQVYQAIALPVCRILSDAFYTLNGQVFGFSFFTWERRRLACPSRGQDDRVPRKLKT